MKLCPYILGKVNTLVSTTIYLKNRQAVSKSDITELTVPVKSETLKLEIQTSGIVRPKQSVNISPKQAGRLVEIYVEQGDIVKQGQVIAEMENEEIQGQVLEAQANLTRAEANRKEIENQLLELKNGYRPEEISIAEAEVKEVQEALKQLQNGATTEVIAQAKATVEEAEAKLFTIKAQSKNTIIKAPFSAAPNYEDCFLN